MFGLMKQYQERQHREARVIAELPKKSRPPGKPPSNSSGNLVGQQLDAFLLASLEEDLAELKNMASIERKCDYKRDVLLPKYAEYVTRLKADGKTHDLLGHWLVWLFDAGDIDAALEHSNWCFAHKQPLPERFTSGIRFFVATQVINWAENELAANRAIAPYFDWLFTRFEQDPVDWNITDALRARLYRLKGLEATRANNLPQARTYLAQALACGAKVKTALEKIEKQIAAEETSLAEGDGAGVDRPINSASP